MKEISSAAKLSQIYTDKSLYEGNIGHFTW
jgi:hypothetical protein